MSLETGSINGPCNPFKKVMDDDDEILKQEELSGLSKEPVASSAIDAAARTVGPKRGQNGEFPSRATRRSAPKGEREGPFSGKKWIQLKPFTSHKWLCSWGYHFIIGVKTDL